MAAPFGLGSRRGICVYHRRCGTTSSARRERPLVHIRTRICAGDPVPLKPATLLPSSPTICRSGILKRLEQLWPARAVRVRPRRTAGGHARGCRSTRGGRSRCTANGRACPWCSGGTANAWHNSWCCGGTVNLRSCGRSANHISLIRHTRPGESRRRTGENRPRIAQVDSALAVDRRIKDMPPGGGSLTGQHKQPGSVVSDLAAHVGERVEVLVGGQVPVRADCARGSTRAPGSSRTRCRRRWPPRGGLRAVGRRSSRHRPRRWSCRRRPYPARRSCTGRTAACESLASGVPAAARPGIGQGSQPTRGVVDQPTPTSTWRNLAARHQLAGSDALDVVPADRRRGRRTLAPAWAGWLLAARVRAGWLLRRCHLSATVAAVDRGGVRGTSGCRRRNPRLAARAAQVAPMADAPDERRALVRAGRLVGPAAHRTTAVSACLRAGGCTVRHPVATVPARSYRGRSRLTGYGAFDVTPLAEG